MRAATLGLRNLGFLSPVTFTHFRFHFLFEETELAAEDFSVAYDWHLLRRDEPWPQKSFYFAGCCSRADENTSSYAFDTAW